MRLVDIIKGAISVKKYGLSKSWYYKSCHIDTNAIKKVAIFAINSSKCDWLALKKLLYSL